MSKAPPKFPTATQRTVSLFTGKTDLEDPSARDGTPPDHREMMAGRPKVKWTTIDGLRHYEADRIGGQIIVEREGMKRDGRWMYRALRLGRQIGVFPNICDAADAVERAS